MVMEFPISRLELSEQVCTLHFVSRRKVGDYTCDEAFHVHMSAIYFQMPDLKTQGSRSPQVYMNIEVCVTVKVYFVGVK